MQKHLKFKDWDFAFINLPNHGIIMSFFGQPLYHNRWQLK
jgi:hypothetical protein